MKPKKKYVIWIFRVKTSQTEKNAFFYHRLFFFCYHIGNNFGIYIYEVG